MSLHLMCDPGLKLKVNQPIFYPFIEREMERRIIVFSEQLLLFRANQPRIVSGIIHIMEKLYMVSCH